MVDYIFIGGTYRGFKVLERLLLSGHVPSLCYVLKEDAHEQLRYSGEIERLCRASGIAHHLRKKLEPGDYDLIRSHAGNMDLAVVCGWRSMLDPEIRKKFNFGLVAAHDSLLPQYRGFAPLNWAIINGEKETGVTLFLIEDGEVDSGRIISQKMVSIEENDYAIDVYEKITRATLDLYDALFRDYQRNTITFKEQDEARATYTCKRLPDDGRIDWRKSSLEILNLIRALAPPYPGSFCAYDQDVFCIRKAKLGEGNNKQYVGRIPGRVIKIHHHGIEVLCGKGSLLVEEWEKKPSGTPESPIQTVKSMSATLS